MNIIKTRLEITVPGSNPVWNKASKTIIYEANVNIMQISIFKGIIY